MYLLFFLPPPNLTEYFKETSSETLDVFLQRKQIFSNWNVIHFPWTHTFLDVFRKFYWLLLKSFKFNIKEFALSTFIEGFEIKIFEILGWYKNTNVSQFFWLSVINQDCWRVWLKSLWKGKQKSCWLNAFKVYWSVRNIDRYFEPDICFGLRTYKTTTPSISKLSTYFILLFY